MKNIKNLANLYLSLPDIYKGNKFFTYKHNGNWIDLTANDFVEKVINLSFAFLKVGFKKNDKISLMCETRYEWFLFDFAMACTGIISVPIYPTLTDEQAKFIIEHSDSKGIVFSTQNLADMLLKYKSEHKLLKYIIIEGESDEDSNLISLEELEQIGKQYRIENSDEKIKEIADSLNENDLASILYTSGTTGTPKGVMLSHKNFLSNAFGALHKLHLEEFYNILLFLPLSHSFSRTCTYGMMLGGVRLWYAEKLVTIASDLIDSQSDGLITVPRVFENIYRKIINNAKEGGWVKFKIFNWAKKIGHKYVEKKQNKKRIPFTLKTKYKIADKLVFKKIRDKIGGFMRLVVSGASTLPKQISFFFNGAGVEIVEGYGLTETSPIVSTNLPGEKNKIGTVGTTFENVEVMLGEGNELMVRGPNVMLGYYKNEKATREVLTDDGWLLTGDIAEIDNEGYIKIIERKKDLFKTSAGKYVVPQKIENLAKINQYIDDFIVIADNKKYASALIVPDFEELQKYAKKNGINYNSRKDLVEKKEIYNLYRNIVKDVINTRLAMYEAIKRFAIIEDPLSIKNGTLTPTMKVKRKVIYTKYKNIINSLYR